MMPTIKAILSATMINFGFRILMPMCGNLGFMVGLKNQFNWERWKNTMTIELAIVISALSFLFAVYSGVNSILSSFRRET